MMQKIRRLFQAFAAEPIGTFTLVVTILLAGVQVWQTSVSQERANLESRATEIRLQGIDFQTYLGAYVAAILDGKPLEDPFNKLTDNVMRQFAAVDLSKSVYSDETIKRADEYKAKLTAFQGALRQADKVTEMRPFWEAAADLLTTRDEFLDALRGQI